MSSDLVEFEFDLSGRYRNNTIVDVVYLPTASRPFTDGMVCLSSSKMSGMLCGEEEKAFTSASKKSLMILSCRRGGDANFKHRSTVQSMFHARSKHIDYGTTSFENK